MNDRNRVEIMGRLGADPEIKSFQNGGRIANMRIATSERWKDKSSGEQKERTEWHSISVQNDGLVGIVERFCRKGKRVLVDGELRTRKWQDRDGNDRYSTEVVVGFRGGLTIIDFPDDGDQRGTGNGSSTRNRNQQFAAELDRDQGGFGGDMDDEIPFISNSIAFERRVF